MYLQQQQSTPAAAAAGTQQQQQRSGGGTQERTYELRPDVLQQLREMFATADKLSRTDKETILAFLGGHGGYFHSLFISALPVRSVMCDVLL